MSDINVDSELNIVVGGEKHSFEELLKNYCAETNPRGAVTEEGCLKVDRVLQRLRYLSTSLSSWGAFWETRTLDEREQDLIANVPHHLSRTAGATDASGAKRSQHPA